jgi:lipoprotein
MRNIILVNKISFFIFIALLWACENNKEIKNIKKTYNIPSIIEYDFPDTLKGKIKSIHIMKYDIEEINGKYVKVPYEKRYDVADYNNATIQFDERGNDIYYYEYDSIRDITIKIEKTFNERDSLLTESHFDNELKPRTYRIVNTYNTDGFKTEESFYDQDSLYERKVYEYNKNKLTKAVLYRKGKEIAHYSYDKEMATSSTDSKSKNEATADPYGESNEINHQEIYDSQGNLSQYKAIYKGGLEEERHFYYDMKGNCIRKEYFENGKPTYVIERRITYYQ